MFKNLKKIDINKFNIYFSSFNHYINKINLYQNNKVKQYANYSKKY